MSEVGPVALGIIIVVLGLAFIALAYFLLRILPRSGPVTVPFSFPIGSSELSSSTEAVLLIQAGGRVVYLNQTAREWFGLLEEAPNIEYLARRTRPGEAFLELCAAQGKARFSLNGRFVDGSSYSLPYGTSHAVLVSLIRPQVAHLTMEEGSSAVAPDQAIDTFAELSQAMAANLDLESALQSILESVERLISSDFSEITTWDPITSCLSHIVSSASLAWTVMSKNRATVTLQMKAIQDIWPPNTHLFLLGTWILIGLYGLP